MEQTKNEFFASASKVCPDCKGPASKVMYMGFPMILCDDNQKEKGCHNVHGFWSFILLIVPFNGMFIKYTGSYLKVLWRYMKGDFVA